MRKRFVSESRVRDRQALGSRSQATLLVLCSIGSTAPAPMTLTAMV